jgi:hypothetical protein
MSLAMRALHRWIAQAEIDAGRRPGLTAQEHAEVVAPRKESRRLREERDLLRRATGLFAFIADRVGDGVTLGAAHRRHAVAELAIRDLKEESGLSHCPSGRFGANGVWRCARRSPTTSPAGSVYPDFTSAARTSPRRSGDGSCVLRVA